MSFFQIFYEKPPAVLPIFVQKKCQICQNYTILWDQKVNRMPFFHEILLLAPALIQKSINIKNGQLHFLDGGLGDLTLNKSLMNWIFNIWTV